MDNDLQPQSAPEPEAPAETAAPAPEHVAAPEAPQAAAAPEAPQAAAAPEEPQAAAAPEAPQAAAAPEAPQAAAAPEAPQAPKQPKPVDPARAQADAARKAQVEAAWAKLAGAKSTREVLDGVVKSAVKGGFLVSVGPFRGFLPASQSRLAGIAADKLAGTKIPVVVLDADDAKKRVVVSHKQALEIGRRAARAELLASLKVGAQREATVVRLADFGAFVDLGGLDALVPVSELALERVDKPSDVVKVGDRFEVRILRVDESGKKIGASRKALLPDPWRDHAELLQRGKVVEGKVVDNAGELKIEIAPGIVGTISENEAIPSDYEIGETVEVSIRTADFRMRRLRLSTMHAAPTFQNGGGAFAPLGSELNR